MVRDRGLLHVSKLQEFATWAEGLGYVVLPNVGTYEVLRLRPPGGKGLVSFYRKATATQHVTAHGEGLELVRGWFKNRPDLDLDFTPRNRRPL